MRPLVVLLTLGGIAMAAPTPTPDGSTCPAVRKTEAFVRWAAPSDAKAPPLDQRPAAHLRIATFALG